jgi:hypothetical protein
MNIPTKIIYKILEKQEMPVEIVQEITKLTNLILDPNYLKHNNQYYKQEGLAMGAPTKAILSELYLQYLEHNEIYNILTKHSILNYS